MKESNEASTSTELINTLSKRRRTEVLDFICAVKGLHGIDLHRFVKHIRDDGNNIVQYIAPDGSHRQVDFEKFTRYLPLHLISVIMAWEKNEATFDYLLSGVFMLHSMYHLARVVPKIAQILFDDVKVSEQLIDLVFYLLVLMGANTQENRNVPENMIHLHSDLVACSLKLLTVIVSPLFQEIAQVLSAYYKVDVFMDGVFSAVCIDVKFLQAKLLVEQAEPTSGAPPAAEETLNRLCHQCDCSLFFLQYLCEQKSFRECIVNNKELCGDRGVLVLVRAVLNLRISSVYMASISRLKSKALSILLHLCEAECVSYLDEVARNHRSRSSAKSIILQVLEVLEKIFCIGSNQLTASSEIVYPKGHLELNAMRLIDVFSDDSNFRSFITRNFTKTLAAIFLLPPEEFVPGWCSSHLPVCEDDPKHEFTAPKESYADRRTSLLIKVIANLHCFVPDICQDEKDLFLNMFVQFIQKESQKLLDGPSSTYDVEKTTAVGKNLCSLLSHAEYLVPRSLNEEDCQLLRLFVGGFNSLMVPTAAVDHHSVQNTGVHPSPLLVQVATHHGNNNDSIMDEPSKEPITFKEPNLLNIIQNGNNNKCFVRERKSQDKSNGPPIIIRETKRDSQAFETSGSDSSPTRGKCSVDQVNLNHFKGSSGFEETMEDEKAGAAMDSDDKQQRKRRRTVMNDVQIALIESAVVDEPNMHRNSTSLQSWADKLSLHGAEVTTSRLKNWLNNRKARLARVAKEACGVSYDGDNTLDRRGSVSAVHLDSSPSHMDDARVQSPARESSRNEAIDATLMVKADEGLETSLAVPRDIIARPGLHFEPGKYILCNARWSEIGKGSS